MSTIGDVGDFELTDDIRESHQHPPLPLYGVLLKMLRCVEELILATCATVRALEKQLQEMTAHTTDRRQYALLLLAIAPAVLSTTKLTIAMISAHCRRYPSFTHGTTLPLERWSKILQSFAACVVASDEPQDRKGPERALQQLLTSMTTRAIQQHFVSTSETSNSRK